MRPDLRAERRVPARNLRRGVFDEAFRRLQPARPHAIAIALAGRGAVLIVLPPKRVPALRLQRLLDNQPRRQLDQLRPTVRRRKTALDQIGKRLARAHRRRYSLRHGVPPC